MFRVQNLLLIGALLFSCMHRNQIDSQTQNFGIPVGANEHFLILDMLQTDNATIKVCLISQNDGPDTDWTKKVKGMFGVAINTWIDAVNRKRPGTLKKPFDIKFISVGYDTFEAQGQESESAIAQSIAKRDRIAQQITAARSDMEVRQVVNAMARDLIAIDEESAHIPACQGTHLNLISYDDTKRALNVTKTKLHYITDLDFMNSHPAMVSKLNRAMFEGAYSDAEFVAKMARYDSDSGRLRSAATRGHIYHPKWNWTDSKYQEILNHEFGHVLGLQDVYSEFKNQQKSSTIALMACSPEAHGIPQESDIQGVFTLISGRGKDEVQCPAGYVSYEVDQPADVKKLLFCKPAFTQQTINYR